MLIDLWENFKEFLDSKSQNKQKLVYKNSLRQILNYKQFKFSLNKARREYRQ